MQDADGQVAATSARLLMDMGIKLSEKEKQGLRRPDTRFSSPFVLPGSSLGHVSQPPLGPIPELLPLSHRRQAIRAVMLLESDGSDEALAMILELSKGSPKNPITEQAKWAAKRLKR